MEKESYDDAPKIQNGNVNLMSRTRIEMKNIILITLLMLAAFCNVYAKEQAEALEELNYTLFTSKNPIDGEPSKYYKLSVSSKSTTGPGVVLVKRMDGEFIEMPVFIDKGGIIRTPDGINDAIIGMDGGYAERFEVLLVISENKKKIKPIAKCVIIPFPRIVSDDKGHKIELQAITSDGEHFSLNGSGFKPNEQITLKSRSCNELLTSPLKTDEEGKFFICLSPAVIGKIEGPFEVTFSGDNMKPLIMRHYWGKVAFSQPNNYKTLRNKLPFPEE